MYEKKLNSERNVEVDEFKFDAIYVNIPDDFCESFDRKRRWFFNYS